VNIPNPLEWGCFTFGIIQGDGHFTFFAAMDHVHGDATLIGTTMLEANGMYSALIGGGKPLELPDAGSFDDFCVREPRVHVDVNRGIRPGVRRVDRLRGKNNSGSFPEFPLPLGDPSKSTSSDMASELLMDTAQTETISKQPAGRPAARASSAACCSPASVWWGARGSPVL